MLRGCGGETSLHTFSFSEFLDLVLVVCMVGVSRVQKVELGIILFILTDTGFKLGAISGNEARCFVDNICSLGKGDTCTISLTIDNKVSTWKS